MDLHQIIKKPLITEKAVKAQGTGPRYAFVVDLKATKTQIRAAIEQLFNVNVTGINTAIIRGKMKRVGRSVGQKSNWKKALVNLKEGEKIELFEGV
ncbi:MAG TPA: 50S ribosomal protein L23 [Deltaproteobacteria bacterium]|nr:MAG: 50S ribosomal protein L23 [Deltaproteobacteria bacterium GWA2_45_12]HBF13579.1 50S ribosomal protein L23 [Deltaproteobacteria bacterium]